MIRSILLTTSLQLATSCAVFSHSVVQTARTAESFGICCEKDMRPTDEPYQEQKQ